MLFEHIGLIDKDFNYQPDMFVGVVGSEIVYVGSEAPGQTDAPGAGTQSSPDAGAATATGAAGAATAVATVAASADYAEHYNGHGRVLMPAFFNAHAHAPMTLLRGYAENLPLQDWLNNSVFPFEDHLTPADIRCGTDLAIAEMLRYGCVSFSDMYNNDDERCAAVQDAHVKMNVSRGICAFDQKDFHALPAYQDILHLLEVWDGACSGRIKADMTLHGEYTNPHEELVRAVAEHCLSVGAIMHVHASESKAEVEGCRQRHQGRSPIEFLADCGIFDSPSIAAHCVWVDSHDLDILKEKDVTVACNPASNMKLASGFAPIPEMLRRDIKVALGTDGPASNNAHNMFRDMYLFASIYKGYTGDPRVITPQQTLYAATRQGALAQGRNMSGLIAPGYTADLCVVDVTGPSMCPAFDMLANLVYSASGAEVVLTMCDGKVVYRDGVWPTIDVEKARALVQAGTSRILAELAQDEAHS